MEQIAFDQYNAYTASNGNIIWAAAMQLAWNQIRQSFTHSSPLLFATEKHETLKAIHNFNLSHFKKGDISAASIYVKSGYGQKTVDTINAEVKKKFPQKTTAPLNYKLFDSDIISFAYLFKKLTFKTKFERRTHKEFSFKNKLVHSFYAKNENQKKQVLVHSYENANNFVVQIPSKQGVDCMFLIKSEKHLTLDDAIQSTMKASLVKGTPLRKCDEFEMPVIKIDEERSYESLINLQFKNPELHGYFIRVMKEIVKLDVNESGAKVENEAVMVLSRCMQFFEDQKSILLNDDFWIVMKESKGHPYLCVLIKNPIK